MLFTGVYVSVLLCFSDLAFDEDDINATQIQHINANGDFN